MGRRGNFFDRAALGADLPAETAPTQTLIEIAGEHRVLVENHKGVTVYGCNRIHIKSTYGLVCVCGNNLKLARMTKQQLVITGRIEGVSLLRGQN